MTHSKAARAPQRLRQTYIALRHTFHYVIEKACALPAAAAVTTSRTSASPVSSSTDASAACAPTRASAACAARFDESTRSARQPAARYSGASSPSNSISAAALRVAESAAIAPFHAVISRAAGENEQEPRGQRTKARECRWLQHRSRSRDCAHRRRGSIAVWIRSCSVQR